MFTLVLRSLFYLEWRYRDIYAHTHKYIYTHKIQIYFKYYCFGTIGGLSSVFFLPHFLMQVKV